MIGRLAHLLLEREAELGCIAELVEQVASTARGAALVVEGPPGIGKTRLLDAVREFAAERELRVLTSRGAELERGFAFGLVRQLLDPPLIVADSAERSELLAGAAALSLGALGESPPGAEPVDAAGVLHGLYWLIAGLARQRPLLLVVDDAHWGDEASLRFLGYLFRRLESLPVLVVVGCRPPSGEPGEALLGELVADPGAEVIRPRTLGCDAVARLLCERLGSRPDREFVEACLAATGGNPFLVSELVRELDVRQIEPRATEAGRVAQLRPENLARSLMVRLRRAGEGAEALAPAIAVLGDTAQLGLVGELVGMAEDVAADALDALVREGVVAQDLPPRFAHPLLRTAAEGMLAPGERSRLHARAARLLQRRGASAERIAPHLFESEPRGDCQVVETLAEAARLARARGAPDVAAVLLRRALEEPPPAARRLELVFDLGSAERALGLDSARVHLRAAAEADDPILAGRATRALVWTRGPDPEALEEALPLLDRAIERLGDQEPELELELEALRLAPLWIDTSSWERFERELQRWREVSGDTAAESLALSFVTVALRWCGEPASSVEAAAKRAAANAAALYDDDMAGLWLVYVVHSMIDVDRLDRAERLLEQAFRVARERGSARRFSDASVMRAICRRAVGDLYAAEADARAVLTSDPKNTADRRRQDRTSRAPRVASCLVGLVGSLTDQGRTTEGERLLATWQLDGPLPNTKTATMLLIERGRLRVLTDRVEAGVADFEEALARLSREFAFVGLGGVEPRLEL
ncbi:MAG: AAA family ATPase, partial [Actinomycetota bacterium]|nr:AAA family ATPase [Actinomycetota bacterium]